MHTNILKNESYPIPKFKNFRSEITQHAGLPGVTFNVTSDRSNHNPNKQFNPSAHCSSLKQEQASFWLVHPTSINLRNFSQRTLFSGCQVFFTAYLQIIIRQINLLAQV